MAIQAVVAAKRDELVQSARLLGGNLSRRACGKRGPDLQVTLADLEQFLRPLVATLAGGFLAGSVEDQTERLSETRPCDLRAGVFAGGGRANPRGRARAVSLVRTGLSRPAL